MCVALALLRTALPEVIRTIKDFIYEKRLCPSHQYPFSECLMCVRFAKMNPFP